jgi:hypothetical protein
MASENDVAECAIRVEKGEIDGIDNEMRHMDSRFADRTGHIV